MTTPRPSLLARAAVLGLAAGLGASLAGSTVGCAEGAPRPNLLIVSFDTLRADRLGAYGNADWPDSPSPHADALSERGVLFETAYAPRGQTHPSLGAMLTGKYPITTGLRENGLLLLPQHRTLFQYLQAAGFHTGVFVANFDARHPGDNWVYRGADVAADGFRGQRAVEARAESRYQSQWDDRVERAALDFLTERDRARPFAAWVHFYDVHKPYNPPAEQLGRYGVAAGVPEPLLAPGPDSGAELERWLAEITLGDREVPAAELRRILGLYDSGVRATDARLGRLLDALADSGELDDTYVIFTSDHGEELYDHQRYFFHGNSVYRGTLQIPLVVAGPGLPTGRRVPALVQNIDIAPTALDLLGVAPAKRMEGRSLAPLLRGETEEPTHPYAFIEWQDVLYAVTDGVHSYVHNPQHAHLLKSPFNPRAGQSAVRGFPVECFEAYDLRVDPLEQVNLLAGLDPDGLMTGDALPPEIAPLRAALQAFLADPLHEREMSWPGLSSESIERMQQIGYVETGRARPDVLFMEPCATR
ncbi:MAG: sulfatase [Planctomycetota bacterium]|jgi:arylsulfatase A-like enzyme